MARIRTIKPEFPQSESMGRVSRDARLCFINLWTISDDVGRCRGNSRMLASLLFPYDDDAPKLITGWLQELEREGAVLRYEIDGNSYIQIAKWLNHQKIDKPSKSKLPEFDEASRKVAKPREVSATDLGPRTMDKDLRKNIGADAPCDVSRETIPSKPKRTPRDALCEILDADHAGAVIDHRRALRKPLTVRAAELLAQQLALARDGPNEAADRMIARGWQGYKPEWDTDHDNRNRSNFNGKPQFSGVVANLRDMLIQSPDDHAGGPDHLSDHEPPPTGRRIGVA